MLLSTILAFLLPLTIAAAPLDDLDDEDAQIVQELYAEDAASAQYISPLRIYSQSSDVNETAVFTNTTASKPAVWACDVRSWVRAPDLSPGATVPAEVRLAMNGSACADVVSWGVGLSMRERGAMKVKAPNATLPIAPTQDYRSSDRVGGSIYTDSLSMMRDEVYHQEYIAYQKALADPALWIVKGLERVAFDAQLDMPSLEDPSNTDVIVPFHAHCPDTNLPPILDQHEPYVHFGEEGTFINAEPRFEYRILLHLSNGTTIEQSAGQAGFLPDPVHLGSETAYLNGIMVTSRPTDDNSRNYDPAPECDRGSRARFNISVASNSLAVPGTNHTFNVTITRFGNGTEHPSSIDLSLTVERNETWAFEFIDYETYMNAGGKGSRHDGYLRWSNIRNQPQILAAKTDAQLEEEHEERRLLRETADEPIIQLRELDPPGARVEISGETERYEFELELPISPNAFPSLNRSLVSYLPSIEIRLNTYFSCANAEPEQEAPVNEWDEFRLPLKPKTRRKSAEGFRSSWRSSYHSALMPIDIMRLPSDADGRSDSVRDYRDPLARAPILTMSSARPDLESFPLLSQEIREEPVEEIRQSKYGWYTNNLLCRGVDGVDYGRGGCWAKDPGGMGRHAAKVWQRKERAERVGK